MSLPLPVSPAVANALEKLGPGVLEAVVQFVTGLVEDDARKARAGAATAVARAHKRTVELTIEGARDKARK